MCCFEENDDETDSFNKLYLDQPYRVQSSAEQAAHQQNTPKQSVGQTAVPPSVDRQGLWIPSSCFGARLRFAPRARAARALSMG